MRQRVLKLQKGFWKRLDLQGGVGQDSFAILSHRGNAEETENAGQDKWQLAEILYDADKISRACYTCPAEKDCNWSGEKKNQKIIWQKTRKQNENWE